MLITKDEILCSVTTVADLDLAKFEQLLVETGCQEVEEGQIEQVPHKNRYQPYPKSSLAPQKLDRQTRRNMRGFAMEALKQIEEARRCENTGKLDIVGC